jgi:hypothetical protein
MRLDLEALKLEATAMPPACAVHVLDLIAEVEYLRDRWKRVHPTDQMGIEADIIYGQNKA